MSGSFPGQAALEKFEAGGATFGYLVGKKPLLAMLNPQFQQRALSA